MNPGNSGPKVYFSTEFDVIATEDEEWEPLVGGQGQRSSLLDERKASQEGGMQRTNRRLTKRTMSTKRNLRRGSTSLTFNYFNIVEERDAEEDLLPENPRRFILRGAGNNRRKCYLNFNFEKGQGFRR